MRYLTSSEAQEVDETSLFATFGILSFGVVWLIPNFSVPWLTFDRELFTAVLSLALCVALLFRSRERFPLPWIALLPAALCIVIAGQYFFGEVLFLGDAWTASMYVLGFSGAMLVGASAQKIYSQQWLYCLFLAVLFASIGSVAIELHQWLGLEWLSFWIIDLPPGGRPFGNIGQPNLLATLLCWGLLANWFLFLLGKISSWVCLLTAIFLLFGVVATQSRTGWLIVSMFAVAAVSFRHQLRTQEYRRGFIGLVLGFVATIAAWPTINLALLFNAPASIEERVQSGLRLRHWASMIHAISEHPMSGWGWLQVGVAQQAGAPSRPAIPELIHYSHNLLLDLLVWNGVPIGATAFILFCGWLWSRARAAQDASTVLVFLAIAAFFVHALLEYPYAYAFVLLPVGMFMGTLNQQTEGPSFQIPRLGLAAYSAGLLAMIAWTATEYYTAKESTMTLRYEMARVGPGRNSPPPDLPLLTQLQAVLTVDRLKISNDISDADLDLLRKTSQRFPSERLIIHYAAEEAARGNAAAAQLALVKLCKLYPEERCLLAKHIWTHWGNNEFPFVKTVPFPDESRL